MYSNLNYPVRLVEHLTVQGLERLNPDLELIVVSTFAHSFNLQLEPHKGKSFNLGIDFSIHIVSVLGLTGYLNLTKSLLCENKLAPPFKLVTQGGA